MKLTNLETDPDYYEDTISLIESAFGYKEDHSYDVDFYPLMSKSNWPNNYVVIDKDEVVAHTGVLKKKISLTKEHHLAFIGGVAVREDYRGQGLASKLLNHALKEHSSTALHVLWSEKTELYEKFGFWPCVELYSCPKTEGYSQFKKIVPTEAEWKELERLYNSSNEVRVKRESNDWDQIKKIKSADVYTKEKSGSIENYFVMNKGMDLNGIVHEYGSLDDAKEIMTHGNLWASKNVESSTPLFGSLIKIGELNAFKSFVSEFTKGALEIEAIVQEVRFKFKGELYSLTQEEFLQGIFGPGRLEELGEIPKLFISGMDSV